jgi:hypothetical protein
VKWNPSRKFSEELPRLNKASNREAAKSRSQQAKEACLNPPPQNQLSSQVKEVKKKMRNY